MKLAGKVVVVTGAASGIGEATAMLFADEGASVVVADHDEVRSEQVAGAIRSRGARALFARTDVSKPDDVQATVGVAAETYGQLDVIFIGRRRMMDDLSAPPVASLRSAALATAVSETKVWWTKVRSGDSRLRGSSDGG